MSGSGTTILFNTITAGWYHTCGTTASGNTYCWGRNNYGQIGDGTTTDQPTPVLVVSSLTTKGAQTTLKAMEMGAADFIPKTQSFVAIDITKIEDDLLAKINESGDFNDDIAAEMSKALDNFKANNVW